MIYMFGIFCKAGLDKAGFEGSARLENYLVLIHYKQAVQAALFIS